MMTKCTCCGKKFKIVNHKKFCSEKCRVLMEGKICKYCGNIYHKSDYYGYCSKDCYAVANGFHRLTCLTCGKLFYAKNLDCCYCSSACVPQKCSFCGKELKDDQKDYCSDKCKRKGRQLSRLDRLERICYEMNAFKKFYHCNVHYGEFSAFKSQNISTLKGISLKQWHNDLMSSRRGEKR